MKKFTSFVAAALLAASTVSAAAPELEVTKEWTPEAPMAITKSWSTILEVPATPFVNSLTEKSVIRLFVTDCGANPQIQIAYKADDSGWTWTQLNDYSDVTGEYLDYSIAEGIEYSEEACEDIIAGLTAHGMFLKGADYSLAKVQVLNPSGEAPKDPLEDYVLSLSTVLDEPLVETSWKEVNVPADPFRLLTEKSIVKLYFTDCGANPQVQVNYKSGEGWTWTSLNEYADIIDDEYMFKMADFADPADAAEWIKARGAILKGQNYTLVKIDIYNPKGEAPVDPMENMVIASSFELPTPLVQTSWKELEVPAAAFYGLTEKSAVRFIFSELGANPQVQLAYKSGEGWTWTQMGDYQDISGKNYVFFIADFDDPADAAEWIAQRGMIIKGQNYTLTAVEVLNPQGEGPEPEPEYELVYTQTLDEPLVMKNSWSTILEIPAENFKLVCADSKIRLKFTDCGANPQAQIVYKADDADWTWTEYAAYTDIQANMIDLMVSTFADPADAVAGLKAHGMFLKGQNFSYAGLELYNPKSSSAITDVEAAEDMNAPVEIYTIQGIRVSQMTPGNLYIVRQGNKVKKIVK